MSSARTPACSDSPTPMTVAAVRADMPQTIGSSALSTANPVAGNARTSSAFALPMASREPNSPTWAVPTLSTTPIWGCAIRVR